MTTEKNADEILPDVFAKASQTGSIPFLVQDMAALVVAGSAKPLTLRKQDRLPYSRDIAPVLAGMALLPKWLHWEESSMSMEYPPEARARVAFSKLHARGWLHVAKNRASPSVEALAWVGGSPGDHVRALLDEMLEANEVDPVHRGDRLEGPRGLFIWQYTPVLYEKGEWIDPRPRIRSALREIPSDGFVKAARFFDYASVSENPFLDSLRRGNELSPNRHRSRRIFRKDDLVDFWRSALVQTVFSLLIPLGCIEWGRVDSELCFRLNDYGRYLLGLVDTFPQEKQKTDGQVVVQPNFDITFLGPSTEAEVRLGPLAQRAGTGVGVLFRLTANSIRSAYAQGRQLEEILDTLRQVTAQPLPRNVEQQVSDWFNSCRKLRSRRSILIDCGDPETALRVLAAAPKDLTQLNPTVLELRSTKAKAGLDKKLARQGIFFE